MKPPANPGIVRLNSNGSAMVYLLAMITFISVVAFNFADTARLYMTDVKVVKNFRGRAFSMNQTQKMLATSNSLLESSQYLPHNEALRVCLFGGASNSCLENCCQGSSETAFTFKDPLDTNAAIDKKRNLTGPPGTPAYYDGDGSICRSAQTGSFAGCTYGLESTFTAHCPGGASNCDHAEHLEIKVRLRPATVSARIRAQDFTAYYFPKVNYPPVAPTIEDQTLSTGTSNTISLTGDSGHPSEIQNFKFEKCDSDNIGILKVQCQAFAGGVGQIILEGVGPGTTKVYIQINDGGLTNSLSKVSSFSVVVNP